MKKVVCFMLKHFAPWRLAATYAPKDVRTGDAVYDVYLFWNWERVVSSHGVNSISRVGERTVRIPPSYVLEGEL